MDALIKLSPKKPSALKLLLVSNEKNNQHKDYAIYTGEYECKAETAKSSEAAFLGERKIKGWMKGQFSL